MSRNGLSFTDEKREELTREVLSAPIELSHQRLGMQLGINRTLVRQIRYGLAYSDVLPGIPRLEPDQPRRRCDQCVHWTAEFTRKRNENMEDIRRLGFCTLGIPEAENMRFGRGCGAFTKAQP
jgi:hypothetical protein